MTGDTPVEVARLLLGLLLLMFLLGPALFDTDRRRGVSGNQKRGAAYEQDELFAELFDDLEDDL